MEEQANGVFGGVVKAACGLAHLRVKPQAASARGETEGDMGQSPSRGIASITRGQWLTLTAALLGWAFDGFEMGVFPLVARPALKELLNTQDNETVRQWNALLNAAFLLGAATGGLLFGWIGDRIGRVRAMTLSVLTYALLTGCCSFAQAAWQLAALRFLAATGMGGEWALGVALVMESWPAHARPMLAGLIGAAANFGYFCVAALALLVKPGEHWRWLLAACTFPALLTFFLRLFVPESEKWAKAAASGPKARVADIFVKGLRHRSLLGAAAGAVALLATWGAVQLTQLWVLDLTTDANASAYAQLWTAGAATIGAFVAPVVLHGRSRRAGYLLLCVVAFASTQYLFLTQREFNTGFLVTVGLVGMTSAAFYGWLPLYLPELFPTRVRAAGQGFCFNAGRAIAALGVLTTIAIDLKGNYAIASAIVCLVYLVGMVLAWWLPETTGQPLPE